MLDFRYDRLKSQGTLRREMGKTCTVPGCGKPLTQMQGPGSDVCCRDHQLELREYGGMGRLDRPHTFQRTWVCSECGWDSLADPRLADVEDEDVKRRIARTLMHGDHHHERKADGGSDGADNVRSLCVVCHAKKTTINEDFMPKTAKKTQ